MHAASASGSLPGIFEDCTKNFVVPSSSGSTPDSIASATGDASCAWKTFCPIPASTSRRNRSGRRTASCRSWVAPMLNPTASTTSSAGRAASMTPGRSEYASGSCGFSAVP